MSITHDSVLAGVEPADLMSVESLFSEEERAIRDRVREFVRSEVVPGAAEAWDRARFPDELLAPLGRTGVLGGCFTGYGLPGWSSVSYGLALQEIARGSGSLSTFVHVQSGLAMAAIYLLGSEEQKQHWLPPMARCEQIGAFGLTEPGAGSDAGAIQTLAIQHEDGYVLTGEKRWIGNGTIADVAVIWARLENGKIAAFLVETARPGYQAEVIPRKGSQRAVHQTRIRLENCRVPRENRLPGAVGFGSTRSVLAHSRYGVAWDGLGQALDCFEIALAYSKSREQFGRPVASFQLAQDKLVRMLDEVTRAQLLSLHVGRLKDRDEVTVPMISLLKMSNLAMARRVASEARDLLGGNGILLDYRVMEHMADIEGVYTYEGTHDVNALIVGHALTGLRAIS